MVAGRFQAPRVNMVLNVGGGQADAGGVDGAPLELVRCDVSEPFLEVFAVDGIAAAGGGDRDHRQRQDDGDKTNADDHESTIH